MEKIMLNDILHLNEDEIKKSKIGLNMGWSGKSHFKNWYESDENNRNVDFTYYSHQGEHGKNRNFTFVGQWCFGFVRLEKEPHKWLLVSAGEITSIPERENSGTCGHYELDRFKGLLGRLIIKYHKGNTFSRYIFNLSSVLYDAEVVEILPNIYEPIKFTGFENVHLSYKTLQNILNGQKYNEYRAALKGVMGIYCLTDTKEGKFYIGSASGNDGILQRWSNYVDNKTGGNQALVELYNEKGDSYFEKYFEYTVIETFIKNTNKEKVLAREKYWKDVFKTKENGYNRN